ncbi:uncharacterized protein LOC131929337 [Physella acuta]|uniref:uncharacterized protein LOC131929337 n=1 Tax=Physella acuta TaxID=109671 RepID=UPI0027DE825E|nr:uncharacterized protein LOC131929337 [Physella acuta]
MVKLNCLLLSLLATALYFDFSDCRVRKKGRNERRRPKVHQSKYGDSYIGKLDMYTGKEIIIEGSMELNSDGYDVVFSSDLTCKEKGQQPLTIYVKRKQHRVLCNTRLSGVLQRSPVTCFRTNTGSAFFQALKQFTLKIIFYTNDRIEVWMNDKYAFNFPMFVRVDLIKALCINIKGITLDWVLTSVEKPKVFIPVNVFSSEAKIIVDATPTNKWFNFELRCGSAKSYNISAQLDVFFNNNTVTVTSKQGGLFLREASYFTDFHFKLNEAFKTVWTIGPDLIEINVNGMHKYHKQDVELCQNLFLYWNSIPIVNKMYMT